MNISLRLMNYLFDSLTNQWGRLAGLVFPFIELSPLVLRIRITNRCNLSCHYCYVGTSLNKKMDNPLTHQEWKRIIEKLPSKTLIDITGGEPFLAPHFAEILSLFLERKLKVSLITNGTVPNEEVLKMVVNKRLTHFMISIDGIEEVHDRIRGKGSFRKAVNTARTINRLKKESGIKNPKLVAKVTLTESNVHELVSLSSYLINEIGFDGITLNLLFQNSARDGFADASDPFSEKFMHGNTVSFDQQKINDFSSVLSEVLNLFSKKIQIRPDVKPDEITSYFNNPRHFSPVGCHKFRSIVTLYSDGVMTPCDLGLNVGNIREVDYDITGVARLKGMRKFTTSFKNIKSADFPGCEGCCLKKHHLKT